MPTPSLTPFPVAPRQVRPARGGWPGTGCARVVLLPFAVVALGSLLAVPLRLWVQLAGTPVTATVDDLTARADRRGRTTYRAAFHYALAGRRHDDVQQVTAAEYARLARGQVVRGRAVVLFGRSFALTEAGNAWRYTAVAAGFAAAWNAVVGLFVWNAYVRPWRTRRLARDGVAVPGTITGRRVLPGRTPRYRLAYAFQTRDRRPFTGEVTVAPSQYDAAADGQAVTVIYDENRPDRSLAYEYSGLTVDR